MEYSALVFDDCKEVEDTYDKLLATIDLFANDENCTQIVVSCKSVWTLRLASSPKNKVMLVQRPDKPYVALSRYPAINFDKDLQAFDTRLLMFCLQKAIESNLAITSYAQAVTLANTPLESVE